VSDGAPRSSRDNEGEVPSRRAKPWGDFAKAYAMMDSAPFKEQVRRRPTATTVSLWMAGFYGLLAFAVLALALGVAAADPDVSVSALNVRRLDGADLAGGRLLVVSKWAYAGMLGTEPVRGDVDRVSSPKDNATVYLKRIVGLPGDRIQMKQGLLHINDVAVTRDRIADFGGDDPCGSNSTVRTKRWRETLPNGVGHERWIASRTDTTTTTNVYTVPADRFSVLGDNRDNSVDSRVLTSMGYVPRENIIASRGH